MIVLKQDREDVKDLMNVNNIVPTQHTAQNVDKQVDNGVKNNVNGSNKISRQANKDSNSKVV